MGSFRLLRAWYVPVFLLLSLSGCQKKNGVVRQRVTHARVGDACNIETLFSMQEIQPPVTLCEAKLVDIPMPLGAQVERAVDSDETGEGGCIFLACRVQLCVDELERFYLQQMELMGWQQTHLFCGPERLINFEKPDKQCAISMRPYGPAASASDVTIFLSRDSS